MTGPLPRVVGTIYWTLHPIAGLIPMTGDRIGARSEEEEEGCADRYSSMQMRSVESPGSWREIRGFEWVGRGVRVSASY